MKPTNILRILLIVAALSGYSAWVLYNKEPIPIPAAGAETTVISGITVIGTADAEALWHEPSTLFLDVRSATDYEYGHIEGAINVPEDELKERLPTLRPRLKEAKSIVVYCGSETCARSLRCTISLLEEGFERTKLYNTGWNDWSAHGLPRSKLPER